MDVQEAIQLGEWHKTEYIAPHEYIVYEWNGQVFRLIREQIKLNGVVETFQGRAYKYWYFDVYKYWVLGPVINRTKV